MRPPTAHERRCWEALNEHRGTVKAAAALGITSAGVRLACEAYMHKMGLPGGVPYVNPRAYARSSDTSRLRSEVVALQAEVERLVTENAALRLAAHPWVEVHRRLAAIEKAVGVGVVVSHRRVADGGRRVRDQRRVA